MSTKTILFGLTTFALGALLASTSPAIGIAPCVATPAATAVATASGTASAVPVISTHAGTADDPIPYGETAYITHTDDNGDKDEYEVLISNVQIGAAAAKIIHSANMFNATPTPGSSYLVATVKGKYIIGSKTAPFKLSYADFGSLSDGQLSSLAFIVPPSPALDFKGFPGAKFTGYIATTIFSDDSSPLITVGVNSFDGTGGIYFASH